MILGHKFKAETMPQIPFATWDIEKGKIGGVIGVLWHDILEKTMNFTTDIFQPMDREWGSSNDDGTWNGMVGGLLENRSQIILAPLYKNLERSHVIDYSTTLGEARTRMFIKNPGREAIWTPFIEPFHPLVWLSVLLIFITMTCFLIASYSFGTEKNINDGSFTPTKTPVVVWGALLSQGSSLDPKSCASKTIFLISFLFGVLLVASYNATLTSYLAVNKVRLPFTTLAGVIGSGYKVGAVGANLDEFRRAPVGSVKRNIGDEIIPIKNYEEGRRKMLNEKFVFVGNFHQIKSKNKDNCLFIDIPQDVKTFQVGLGFPKSFEFAALFNQAIQKNSENGCINRIVRKWIVKPHSDCFGGTKLGWENVISAFVLIGGGMSLSFVVLCIEMVRSKVDSMKMIGKALEIWR